MGHTLPGVSTLGSLLGPILFNVFVSDLEEGMELTLIKSADDTKLREQMDTLEDQAAIQGNLDTLEEQANRNLMTFSKDKCKVLPLGRKHPCSSPGWGGTGWGAALREWPWGPSGQLNMGQPNMGQPCALAARMASSLLGSVSRDTAGKFKGKDYVSFFSTCLTMFNFYIQF